MTATDLADYLVKQEVPFRQAHGIVGQVVSYCIEQGRELTELALDELQRFSPAIGEDVFAVLSIAGSIDSRQSIGGTGVHQVKKALAQAEEVLGL